MKALVIVEHNNKSIKTSTFSTVTAASQICDSVDALIVGNQLQEAVDEIKKANDLRKVLNIMCIFFIFLLLIVPILGYEIKGATRWIKIFGS